MHDENIVRALEVSEGNGTTKATYFVEHGVLHACIDGRTIRMPVGSCTSDEAVRRLIIGQIQMKAWRQRMAERWLKLHG